MMAPEVAPQRTNGEAKVRRIPVTEQPIFDVDQDVYTATFNEARLEFDYVTPERGGIWAEMAAFQLPHPEPIYRARLNLITGNTRRDAAADLKNRTNGLNIDWALMIERASQWVVDRVRKGEDAVILRDVEPREETSGMLLPPLLVEDGSTILFGPGGSAKSFLALAMALSLHTGEELIEGMPPARPMRVAYCDWEWEPQVHLRRMKRLWKGELPDLVYVKGRMPISEERDRLRHIIRQYHIEYLIVDSIVEAADDDPETANTARRFYGVLNSLGIHGLLLAHVTKGETRSKSDTEAPFGSIFWSNAARSTWHVRPQDNPPPDALTVGLYHRKPNDGPRQSPFALQFTFGDEHVKIERKAPLPANPIDQKVPLRFRLIELLKGGSMVKHEIAEELNESMDAVRMALGRGEGKDFVRLPGPDGVHRWGLRDRPESS